MNGSRAASLTVAWRFSALRVEGFPWIPTVILSTIALVAIFANVLAPYNPEVGVLGDRFRPPAWEGGGERGAPARHRSRGTRRALAPDLRRPRLHGGGVHRGHRGGHPRHGPRHCLRLSRGLGRPGDHAGDGHLARLTRAHLRHLPRRGGRPERDEHRHHPGCGVLDALRKGDPG